MLYELAEAAAAESNGSRRPLPLGLARLEAILTEDAANEGATLGVALTEGCGAIEVQVSGSTASLRLLFDRAELHPPYVRQVVRKAVTRYRSALGCPSSSLGKE